MLDLLTDAAAEQPVQDGKHAQRLQQRPQKAEERALIAQLERGHGQLTGYVPVVVLGFGAWHVALSWRRQGGFSGGRRSDDLAPPLPLCRLQP